MSKANYNLTIDNHPASRRHPTTGKVLIGEDGQRVPLVTDQKCIKLDGLLIAYVMLSTGRVCFVRPEESLGDVIISEAEHLAAEAVAEYKGCGLSGSHFVAEAEEEELEDEDEE